jgi:hypothetical protein
MAAAKKHLLTATTASQRQLVGGASLSKQSTEETSAVQHKCYCATGTPTPTNASLAAASQAPLTGWCGSQTNMQGVTSRNKRQT